MIHSVLSFMGAWGRMLENRSKELDSLTRAIREYALGNVNLLQEGERPHYRQLWEKALYDQGWNVTEQTFFSTSGRKLPVRFIGPQSNGVAAQIAFNNPDFLTRWLFTYATVAVRNGVVENPVMVVPMKDTVTEDLKQRPFSRTGTFEYYHEQLEMLSPISLNIPFLIVGYSLQETFFDAEVIELERDEEAVTQEPTVVVNKCIEFPPEYHQAGLGTLNYFARYLKENYPDEEATVRIEQNGLNVRMVVDTEDGDTETIEQALHEYSQIVSGKQNAETFTANEKLILELRNEVRVAKFRIESQQDVIALQNQRLESSEARVNSLLSLVERGLTSERTAVNVQVNPRIQASISVTVNADVSSCLSGLEDLIEAMPKDDHLS